MPSIPPTFPDMLCDRSSLLTVADAEAIHDLYRRCDDYFLVQDGEHASLADAETLFTDVPASRTADDQIVVGGWRNGRLHALAAVLSGYPETEDHYLGLLLLDPSIRGQGVGQSICSKIELWTRAQGAHRLLVAVLSDNAPAIRFWMRCGFQEIGVTGPKRYKSRTHVVREFAKSLDCAGPE